MEPDGTVTAEGGEEEAFPAEEHRFESAGALDVVLDAGRHRDEASGVHSEGFPAKFAANDGTAGVYEGEAVASETLEDEAFPTEEAGAEALGERDSDGGAEGGAEERAFFAKNLAAQFCEAQGNDFARVRSGECDAAFALWAAMGEVRHEQGLSGEKAFADAGEGPEEAAAGGGSVAHFGFERDIVLHEAHSSGLRDDGFAGVEFHFDKLHVIPMDFVIDIVGSGETAGRASTRRERGRCRMGGFEEIGECLSCGLPRGHAFRPDEGIGSQCAVGHEVRELGLEDVRGFGGRDGVEPSFHGG
ncbi:MAG: hypothetical protein RIS92_3018 [Verrucomicrobiota bacterium]